VRQRGYAVNQEEWRSGVCAIAVPLRGERDAVVASLSLTMPTERFQRTGAHGRFLKPLRRAAEGISAQLGAPPRID
jgi:DNA-binding IclR family transcriptional regulator